MTSPLRNYGLARQTYEPPNETPRLPIVTLGVVAAVLLQQSSEGVTASVSPTAASSEFEKPVTDFP